MVITVDHLVMVQMVATHTEDMAKTSGVESAANLGTTAQTAQLNSEPAQPSNNSHRGTVGVVNTENPLQRR